MPAWISPATRPLGWRGSSSGNRPEGGVAPTPFEPRLKSRRAGAMLEQQIRASAQEYELNQFPPRRLGEWVRQLFLGTHGSEHREHERQVVEHPSNRKNDDQIDQDHARLSPIWRRHGYNILVKAMITKIMANSAQEQTALKLKPVEFNGRYGRTFFVLL